MQMCTFNICLVQLSVPARAFIFDSLCMYSGGSGGGGGGGGSKVKVHMQPCIPTTQLFYQTVLWEQVSGYRLPA